MRLHKETAELLEGYFAGDASPELIEAMEAWLREDPAHPRVLAEYGLIDRLIGHEQKNQDASAIFASLLEAEEAAEPDYSVLNTPSFEKPSPKSGQDTISFRELYVLAGYYAGKGLRTKAAIIGSIAAVLLLGIVLLLVILGEGNTADTPETADNAPSGPSEAGPADPVVNLIVATVTAEHDAVWDRRPGDGLLAAQRLSLLEGFAEITTQRGAVALLEAPCTIELIHDNAIRLERGRLVGIVETEQAKGFLVRTAQMDVVDLGTRFGVEAEPKGNRSVVYVFDGLVEASPLYDNAGQDKAVRLEAEQGLVARAGRDLRTANIDPNRFVSDPAVLPYQIETDETARFLGLDRPDSLVPEALESNQWMHVVLERTGVNVAADLSAGITEPGTYRSYVGPGDPVVYEGRVDSYLAHLDPVGIEQSVTLSGEITFPRPIVAVLVNGEQLIETDSMFANPGTELYRQPDTPFGLDGTEIALEAEQIDELVLAEDRRTLRYRLFALQPFDEFRVLIEAAE